MSTPESTSSSGELPPRPLVSVLIVNYNGAGWLSDCLDSLGRVTYRPREVVVVDNGSRDGSLAVLAAHPEVRVVCSDTNLGFAGGNNLGLRHCMGDLILLLNNDTRVTPGFLEPLVDHLRAHREVGIVQGKMRLCREGGVLDVCGSYLTAFGFLYHVGYRKPDGPRYGRSYPVFTGKGACLMFRRGTVAEAGGFLFDDTFFCYYEETDFCHRAWLAGWETHFVPGSVIDHLHGATGGDARVEALALRHYLRNQTFGLLSNLAGRSLVWMLPMYLGLYLASMLAALGRLRGSVFMAHLGALGACLMGGRALRDRRRLVRRIRRRSDPEIFARVLRTPRLSYFWRSFTGTLARYEDGDFTA
jgi:GT2 family glycosyltransferase